MRTRATDSGTADGWRAARIGALGRQRARDAHRDATRRQMARVDLGEPGVPLVTVAFMLLTIVMTVVEFSRFGSAPTTGELSRAGGAGVGTLAVGTWWKLLTANLLHSGVPHLLSNLFVIYLTGRWLEHLVGRRTTVATILWSALLASVGSLLVDTPSVSIGASGVAFGLVGCAIAVDPRAHTGVGVIGRQLGVVNVVLTFVIPGISIGGHLGGLAAGVAVGALAWRRTAEPDHPAGRSWRIAPAALIAAALPFVAVLAVAPPELPAAADDSRRELVAWLVGRQLSGAELSGGRTVEEASCAATADPLTYACDVDGDEGRLVFDEDTEQWSLATRDAR